MRSSVTEVRAARAEKVRVTDEALIVDLVDGRTVSVPVESGIRVSRRGRQPSVAGGSLVRARGFTGHGWMKISPWRTCWLDGGRVNHKPLGSSG